MAGRGCHKYKGMHEMGGRESTARAAAVKHPGRGLARAYGRG
jgi:hypothetical protein